MPEMKDYAELMKRVENGATVSIRHDQKTESALLDGLISRKKTLGVYLTTKQPHGKIIETLEKEGIDHTSLFFLDTVGKEGAKEDNVFILRDPSDLTELSVVITEVMENEGITFLIIDTVGGLETYAESTSAKKFLHALVSYVKKLGKSLVMVYDEQGSKELMDFAAQISDYRK